MTGSQDGFIRLWKDGQKIKEWKGHENIVRGFANVPSMQGFASCSNDQIVKLWALDGTHLIDYTGHSSFIFAIDALPSGEIVSGGEDCCIKIWDGGECK